MTRVFLIGLALGATATVAAWHLTSRAYARHIIATSR